MYCSNFALLSRLQREVAAVVAYAQDRATSVYVAAEVVAAEVSVCQHGKVGVEGAAAAAVQVRGGRRILPAALASGCHDQAQCRYRQRGSQTTNTLLGIIAGAEPAS